MPILDLGQVQLSYTDAGASPDPTAPTLVLIHGWTCDSHDWLFQHDAFAQQHRVVALDLRGHGRSSAPEAGYSPFDHAGDIVALLKHLRITSAIAVGHSLGGVVAAALAVEHPDLVVASVVVEPAYGQDEATVEFMRGACNEFGSEAGNALAAELIGATEPLTPGWLRTWHRRRILGVPPALLQRSFEGLYFVDSTFAGQPRTDPYLARRTSPVLAFHRLPDMAAWEQGLMSHPLSHAVSWEGSGHWLHQERAEEFNDLVLTWVDSLHPAGPTPAVEMASSGERA